MLFQEHMLKCSTCYEFVPGYYPIALDYFVSEDSDLGSSQNMLNEKLGTLS